MGQTSSSIVDILDSTEANVDLLKSISGSMYCRYSAIYASMTRNSDTNISINLSASNVWLNVYGIK